MPTVLIIEDEQALIKLFSKYLQKNGFNIISSYSAEEALKITNSKNIDVVVVDIGLPGMSGLEFTKKVVHEYQTEVIVVTADSNHDYMESINIGATDFMLKPINPKELVGRIRKAINNRQLRLENIKYLKMLQTLVTTDELTQLNNIRKFNIIIEEECKRSSRYEYNLSLIFIDIDNFKLFNDSYGHTEGDNVLRIIGRIISNNLRGNDSAYRYGGEEFTIILPETNEERAMRVAERLRKLVQSERFKPKKNGDLVYITISIGITEFRHDERVSEFVDRADRAMYTSKQTGKNRTNVL